MNKANENILELIEELVKYKINSNKYMCQYPTYQYPETEEEIKYHKIYCDELGCDKCKEIYEEKLTEYYKNKYFIKEEIFQFESNTSQDLIKENRNQMEENLHNLTIV